MFIKAPASRFLPNLGRVDKLLAAPYGYTVSLWVAGTAAASHYGLPTLREILTFAAGAVGAFLLLSFWLWRHSDLEVAEPAKSEPIWLFDLDNTLYPPKSGLMDAISARIDQFIERKLNLPLAVAEAVRQAYFGCYGSSIGGVLRHCQVDAGELIDFVHDLPLEDYLSPDPRLADMLSSLPGRKFVFTNAPADYAWRALRALSVDKYFDGVFDIYFGGLEGKPSPAVYEKVLAALGRLVGMCWLVDDSLANLLPAKALGCRTAWITPDGKTPPVYVDRTVRHLTELRDILKQTSSVQEKKRHS